MLSPEAVQGTAKVQGAGPEEKKGVREEGESGQTSPFRNRKISSDVPLSSQPSSSTLAEGESRGGSTGSLSLTF